MPSFSWPDDKRAALSLSFDDARASQLNNGVPLLDGLGVCATFYVSPHLMEKRADEWRQVAQTHELGNHTLTHPCSGNFRWSRPRALEDYTLEKMQTELVGADKAIQEYAGVTPQTFAYPCGQIFVGRGAEHRSYVPLVAKHFLAGRGYLGESANDPTFCDLSLLTGAGFDKTTFDDLKPRLENALENGDWLILAGHDIGDDFPRQGVYPATIEAVVRFAQQNNFWIDTVANIAQHLHQQRTNTTD